MSSTLTVYGLAALDVLATSLPLRWLWPRVDLEASPPPEVCAHALHGGSTASAMR